MEEKYEKMDAKMEEKMEEKMDAKYVSNNNCDIQNVKAYIHEIRNSKTFNIETLQKMNDLSYNDRLEILFAYNEMITYYTSLLNDNP